MGWCSGSQLAEELWEEIKKHIPKKKRQKLAKKIYDMFCDLDADCWDQQSDSLWAIAEPEEYKEYREGLEE